VLHPTEQSHSPACERTGLDVIVVRSPLVQGAIVGDIVVGGTLAGAEVLLLRTRLHVADAIAGALAAATARVAASTHLLHDAPVAGARAGRPFRPG